MKTQTRAGLHAQIRDEIVVSVPLLAKRSLFDEDETNIRARDVRLTAARRTSLSRLPTGGAPGAQAPPEQAPAHAHRAVHRLARGGGDERADSVGKKLRKCNVAVDVVSFGDVDENAEKLEAFMGAVNKNNNSNLVTVPPGANLADVLLSTPIFMDEDSGGGSGFAAAAAAASSHAAMQGFDGGEP
jgi:hypothetical protein